jgi:membrane associated rhomboid family serine protease
MASGVPDPIIGVVRILARARDVIAAPVLGVAGILIGFASVVVLVAAALVGLILGAVSFMCAALIDVGRRLRHRER